MPQAIAAAAVWVGNTIGAAAGATLTAAGVSASVALPIAATVANVAMFVSEIALYTGLNYIVDDIAHQKPAPMGQELNLRLAADVPREMFVGIRATGGSMVARYSRGSNLYNAHFATQLADHPCTELSKVYADGRLVLNTPLTHGVRTEITAFSYSGGPRVWMTWHDGRPGQTVDSDLVSKSALDPDVVAGQIAAWSSTHYGAGNAWVHIEVQYDSDILTSIPEFLFVIKGAKFYDRRLDTTAGGSGAHRLTDPSTWAYTTNAAVVLDHYLLGYKVEDDDLAFGIGLEPDEVPYAEFQHLADLCDEDVTTGVSPNVEVIKRYAVNGIISAAQAFEDVLESLQIQMAARIVDLGGRIGIIGAEERASVVTLDDDDWADDDSVRYADKLQFSDLYGGVAGAFPDPANLYQPTPYDRITTDYLALPDGGEATIAQVDLPFETHPRRAARLASAWISREALQPRLVGTFATRSLAWKLEPGDWFTMSSVILDFPASLFEVVDIVKHEDFTVTVTARAIDPNFLAFSTAADPDLSVPPAVSPASLLLDAPSGNISAITITGGGATEPALRFTLTSAPVPTREIVIEVMEWTGSALTGDPILTSMHSDESTKLVRSGIIPGKQYKARAKARLGSRESAWTAYSSAVTASSTYTVPGSSLATAIVGQAPAATDFTIQPGATKNTLSFSASAPVSPTDGDIWVDTSATPYVIKTRVSSAWQTSASYGGVFGGTLYEAGGGAVATLANFKTILGTAAAITGQAPAATDTTIQAGATKNTLTYSASAPGSPTNGDIWVDTSTTPIVIKTRVAGVWQNSGNYGGVFGDSLLEAGGGAVATLSNFKTALGTAAAIAGQGALATAASAAWGSQVSGRPTELTDGRVAAGLDASGYVSAGLNSLITVRRLLDGLSGPNLAVNPEFSDGAFTGWGLYDNSGTGKVTATVQINNLAPNASRRQVKISYDGTGAESTFPTPGPTPGWGGAYQLLDYAGDNNPSRPGKYAKNTFILYKIWALIPVGRNLNEASNATGAEGGFTWLTSTAGTGGWQLYVGYRYIGSTGTFSSTGYLYVTGGSNTAFDWYIAKWEQVDIDGSSRTYLGNSLLDSNGVPRGNSDLITNLGTSAAITGQGLFATGNYYEQSSDPGSVANGSFWFKTTTNELYIRRSGAWGLVATISAGGMTASASPSSINEIHAGSSFSSGTITITPSGGTSYTYSVSFNKSGGAANVTLSATNSASFTATASLSSGQDVTGGIIVQIFDSGGKPSIAIRIPLNFSRTD